jgi:hypothetical protein
MTLPNFTAEASLLEVQEQYAGAPTWIAAAPSASIVPQAPPRCVDCLCTEIACACACCGTGC